eukprot:m.314082 g.314082  ORF g.314082 m.314082 type:complete len:69 (-) comp15969_c0_seq2:22-228(-)
MSSHVSHLREDVLLMMLNSFLRCVGWHMCMYQAQACSKYSVLVKEAVFDCDGVCVFFDVHEHVNKRNC